MTGRRRNQHGDVSVLVVVIAEHCENLLAREEGRLAPGELLGRAWHCEADPPDPAKMFLVFAGNRQCPCKPQANYKQSGNKSHGRSSATCGSQSSLYRAPDAESCGRYPDGLRR